MYNIFSKFYHPWLVSPLTRLHLFDHGALAPAFATASTSSKQRFEVRVVIQYHTEGDHIQPNKKSTTKLRVERQVAQ